MGTLLMRQASTFLQEKYRAARLAFTDVSEAKLWAEQVTDNNPWSPDTKTMTQIAEASYDFEEYWRIVDVLHKRLSNIDWRRWRQYYNSLILLEFLITHGSEDFVVEFKRDVEAIKELGTFHYVDSEGVRWGIYMKNKCERVLKLMQGGPSFQEARFKAIKITNEIHGFGSSSSSSSSSSPRGSWTSSFDSYSLSSPTWQDMHEIEKDGENNDGFDKSEILDLNTIQETFDDINLNDKEDEKKVGFFRGLCIKHIGYSPLKNDGEKQLYKSFSDVGNEKKKMLHQQHSFT